MANFVEIKPKIDTLWRAIILFGRNVASYKFALGRTLLDLADQETTFIKLEDLAEPYAKHLYMKERYVALFFHGLLCPAGHGCY